MYLSTFEQDNRIENHYQEIKKMVKCPKCGDTRWTRGSSITITEDYLKTMKEGSSLYKYNKEHPEWVEIARVGNFIVEFRCKNCNLIIPELCY